MKQTIRWQRILILVFLSITVFAPILFFPRKIAIFNSSNAQKEFLEDVSSIKHVTDTVKLNAIQQEIDKGLKHPEGIVYQDRENNSVVGGNFSDNHFGTKDNDNAGGRVFPRNGPGIDAISRGENQPKTISVPLVGKGQSNQATMKAAPSRRSQSRKLTTQKVREMKDQLITAKAYLNFAPPSSKSHLVRELKQRIKEVERALGEVMKDSYYSRSSLQKMKSMEVALYKASRVYSDCSPMAMKLRAMTRNAEEQLEEQRLKATYLNELAARTFPKGLHCLSMQLTVDYHSLQPAERKFLNSQKFQQLDLYHYALFSDNVLACAVVVNSTVSASMEPGKIVFHVVTDSLNLPAITMWFLANPPGEATIQVESIDDFKWLPSGYGSMSKQTNSLDTSALNHLRFYLPEIFPALDKIVLLDHDVVVQRDLRGLWSVDMKGKVNGAVETCGDTETSYRMDMFLNFSDPTIAKRFDINACTWAFGMNVFDLREWRRRNLTTVYHKWLQLGNRRQLWKDGSLPLGLVTFYDLTVAVDRRWHVHGLGYDSGMGQKEIEIAAVIHYDGSLKPWLEIGIREYKGYWNKYLPYSHPYLRQCNIHE